MKNNAIIIISNCQGGAREQDVIEETRPGMFYLKNGKFYILYEEEQDAVMVIIDGGQAVMRRSGTCTAVMRFKTGKKDAFTYRTPYGAMPMELVCSKAEAALSEEGGAVFLQYKLQFGGEEVQNNLTIHVRKECI